MTITSTMTASTSNIPRGPVEVELNFFEPPTDGGQPIQYAEEPPAGEPAANYHRPVIQVTLTDIRGQESQYNLDDHAFQCLPGALSGIPDEIFLSDDQIKATFYPKVEQLLLDHVEGAHRVVIFHHAVRMDRHNSPTHCKPLLAVHADQTAQASAAYVRSHIPDPTDAAALLGGRYRIINVWKPLNGPVESSPLAFASGNSVDASDCFPIELRLASYTSETVGVRYNPGQKWMYWSGMENEDSLLLKCSDSKHDVPFQVPHSAFADPRSPPGAKPRESIEVRALVFG
ncbi:hypothetical protein BDV28DRAFT_145466 [Aspergillus coremiiformis]|uniref:Methyltransferase n=1 Tax=Aspergillus coremiiformis TaxID=138285 RepID=A0A5N6ZEN0_9EURO|nr:hypothetical protein BDV28DRAFT_145466 [Aspergillus coremiiformis]